jgi:hypothetical protein
VRLRRVFFAVLCCACIPYGEGTGQVQGTLTVPRCTLASTGVFNPQTFPQFDLTPSWFFGQLRGNVLELRIQRDSRGLNQTDGLVIEIRDVTTVQTGAAVNVLPDVPPYTGAAAPVRMQLMLKGSCNRFESNLLGLGSITFSAFDARDNGVVDGTFQVSLVDEQAARLTGEPGMLGSLTGQFHIPLHLIPEPG